MQQSAAGAVDLTNSYRPDGLRHRRTDSSGTTQMIWDGDEPLAQVDTAGNLIQYWSRAGTDGAAWDGFELQERGWARLVKARVPGSANPDQYLHADWQGTVLASSGASGVGLVQNYPPRAWGQDSTTLAPFSWLGSHGYWYEGQLARTMHYVRARWYGEVDPHGWLSPDPLGFAGGDWNLYRYVRNRPTIKSLSQ